jgi:hypothetical protein
MRKQTPLINMERFSTSVIIKNRSFFSFLQISKDEEFDKHDVSRVGKQVILHFNDVDSS